MLSYKDIVKSGTKFTEEGFDFFLLSDSFF